MIQGNAIVEKLTNWFVQEALPFWSKPDHDAGVPLFAERRLANRTADPTANRRVRVQLRQIYALSHAAHLGWLPEGAKIAHDVWQATLAKAYAVDGEPGFVHVLSPSGQVLDARRDSYDHAFAVLAAAWLSKVTGDEAVANVLRELLSFADTHLTDSHGALKEGRPDSLPYRQNPQMHWFESMLALVETGAEASGLDRAKHHRALFDQYFYDAATRSVGEYFNIDWTPLSGEGGQRIEPGHHAEWVWLLRRHETLAGLERSEVPSRLLAKALLFRNPQTGLLIDEGTRDGQRRTPTCRIWVQTELIKAFVAQHEAGIAGAKAKAIHALEDLDTHYLSKPFTEGWIDQVNADGSAVSGPVQTSILYHLLVAIVEARRVIAPL